MTVTITPSRLRGSIVPPPSKSESHRLLIAAALSEGDSLIQGLAESEDLTATRRCLEELGAAFEERPNGLTVHGMGANSMSPWRRLAYPRLDCGESGSTLRFLIPVALAVRGGGWFTGQGRLMERPQDPYFALFQEKGIFYEQKDGVLTVQGELTPGEYRLPGNVSSQFVTGLLYALSLVKGDSRIVLTTPLESAGYVNMTRKVLETFGVVSKWEEMDCLFVPGGQTFHAANVRVEPDWSQAAFWYAAAGLGNDVTVEGMNDRTLQMDRKIVDWIRMVNNQSKGGGTVSIDVSMNPDIVPPIAAVGALMNGVLELKNAVRLRWKESDRLASIREELGKLGAQITEEADRLTLTGVETLHGAVVDAHNDHRIAMMIAVAATRADGPVILSGGESVRKSYPDFWEDYVRLGGRIEVTEP